MNLYRYYTKDGQAYWEQVNPFDEYELATCKVHAAFERTKKSYPTDDKQPEGTEVRGEELAFPPQFNNNGVWTTCLNLDAALHRGYEIRYCARLKLDEQREEAAPREGFKSEVDKFRAGVTESPVLDTTHHRKSLKTSQRIEIANGIIENYSMLKKDKGIFHAQLFSAMDDYLRACNETGYNIIY